MTKNKKNKNETSWNLLHLFYFSNSFIQPKNTEFWSAHQWSCVKLSNVQFWCLWFHHWYALRTQQPLWVLKQEAVHCSHLCVRQYFRALSARFGVHQLSKYQQQLNPAESPATMRALSSWINFITEVLPAQIALSIRSMHSNSITFEYLGTLNLFF